jgi:hypothetical protein
LDEEEALGQDEEQEEEEDEDEDEYEEEEEEEMEEEGGMGSKRFVEDFSGSSEEEDSMDDIVRIFFFT